MPTSKIDSTLFNWSRDHKLKLVSVKENFDDFPVHVCTKKKKKDQQQQQKTKTNKFYLYIFTYIFPSILILSLHKLNKYSKFNFELFFFFFLFWFRFYHSWNISKNITRFDSIHSASPNWFLPVAGNNFLQQGGPKIGEHMQNSKNRNEECIFLMY